MSQDESATVAISPQWQNIYDRLCRRGQKQPGEEWYIFEQMTGLFTLCAATGHRHNRTGITSKGGRVLKWEWFHDKNEKPILQALAWKISGNRNILENPKKILKTVGPYAEGGMMILEEEISKDFMNQHKELSVPANNELEKLLLAYVMKAAKFNPFASEGTR